MHPIILCGIGAAVGLLAGALMGSSSKSVRVEEVLVGMFGAFIGGEFVFAQLNGGQAGTGIFSLGSLGLAIAGAVTLLVLLRLMRGVVGPLRPKKSKARR